MGDVLATNGVEIISDGEGVGGSIRASHRGRGCNVGTAVTQDFAGNVKVGGSFGVSVVVSSGEGKEVSRGDFDVASLNPVKANLVRGDRVLGVVGESHHGGEAVFASGRLKCPLVRRDRGGGGTVNLLIRVENIVDSAAEVVEGNCGVLGNGDKVQVVLLGIKGRHVAVLAPYSRPTVGNCVVTGILIISSIIRGVRDGESEVSCVVRARLSDIEVSQRSGGIGGLIAVLEFVVNILNANLSVNKRAPFSGINT